MFIKSSSFICGYIYKAHVTWALIREPAKIGAVAAHFGLCRGILHNAGGVVFWGPFLKAFGICGREGCSGCRPAFLAGLRERNEMLGADIFSRLGTGQRPDSVQRRGCANGRVIFLVQLSLCRFGLGSGWGPVVPSWSRDPDVFRITKKKAGREAARESPASASPAS